MSVCKLSDFYDAGSLTHQGEKTLYVSGIVASVALLVGAAVLGYFYFTGQITNIGAMISSAFAMDLSALGGIVMVPTFIGLLATLKEPPQEIPARAPVPDKPVKGLNGSDDVEL